MNFFDWIIIAILGFCLVQSTVRGGMREIFSLLALVAAFTFSSRYYTMFAKYLSLYIKSQWFKHIVAFVVLFVLVYITIKLFGWLAKRFLTYCSLSMFDRTVGAFIGAAKGAFIVCFIVTIFLIVLPAQNKAFNGSVIFPYCIPFIEKISDLFPSPFKKIIDEKMLEIKRAAKTNNAPQKSNTSASKDENLTL